MYDLSGNLLRELFVKGELSATEIAHFFLKRIDKHDPQIRAFLSLFSDRTLQKAKELDEKRAQKKPLGKLASIPIALKDNIHLFGERSSCGSKFLSNYKAPFSATVSELLEKEDALIIGKTNLDEFAMGSSTENSAFQITKNPWNLSCSPGGSSGGLQRPLGRAYAQFLSEAIQVALFVNRLLFVVLLVLNRRMAGSPDTDWLPLPLLLIT